MTQWFSQLDVLAQRDGDEWMNILFIVVVVVFWAVGALVKAAGAKGKAKQQQGGRGAQKGQPAAKRQTLLQQLMEKAEEFQRAIEGEEQKRSAPARPAQKPRPASSPEAQAPGQGRIGVRTGPGGKSVLVYERKQSSSPQATTPTRPAQPPQPATPPRQRPPQRPQPSVRRPAPVSREVPELLPTADDLPRYARPRTEQPKPTVSVAATAIDPSDPETLRRAILHYEILGKPLALRDPFERTSFS